jgi:D-hydroxyproline dehydrogenase subunit beta
LWQEEAFSNRGRDVTQRFDLAVVGAGILGLAHALAAVRRGLSVVVIDRDAQANGASVRNFGFVTVTGQRAGDHWRRARRSRDVWAEVAPLAGIPIVQHGSLVTARHPESLTLIDAFLATDMGEGCRHLSPAQAHDLCPGLTDGLLGALWSPHELRVESRTAIPQLAAWLEQAHGVAFRRGAMVHAVALPRIATSTGPLEAEACIVCPGEDFLGLYPERIAAYGLTKCLLQMLRVRPAESFQLALPVMSDLTLARYDGYAMLPEAGSLKARIAAERPAYPEAGIHLIAVASADGSLVVGDSHVYADTPEPFASAAVDSLILDELAATLAIGDAEVIERWTGIYASGGERLMLRDAPEPAVRLVMVTSGTGASTSFAIAEETMADLYD